MARKALVLIAALGLGACAGGGPENVAPPTSSGGRDTTTTTAEDDLQPSPPTEPSDGDALPTGTLVAPDASGTCAAGADECRAFEVRCAGIDEAGVGEIDVRRGTSPDRGVVVLFTGSTGNDWWLSDNPEGTPVVDAALSDGLTVVQVRWAEGGWLHSPEGDDDGPVAAACRPATVIRWVHDNVYAPMGIDAPALQCGFCIAGNSGGASQVAYSLAYYGVDDIVDVAVPSSGPPHGDLVKGCLHRPGEEDYWYDTGNARDMDSSFGYRRGEKGPCSQHDPIWEDRWAAEGAATGGYDYEHPDTRIVLIVGGHDPSPADAHARDYAARLEDAGSPNVDLEVLASMGHALDAIGLAALEAALLATG